MPEQVEAATQEQLDQQSRELPDLIVIPSIKGEMVHLRPSVIEDLERMDAIGGVHRRFRNHRQGSGLRAWRGACVGASFRGMVPRRNADRIRCGGSGVASHDRMVHHHRSDHDGDGEIDAANSDNVIGMIFLIDIDGWARSARIQVVLGKDYRGRGYSRDIMPRVMTYGLAPEPAGLGMHRIWVAVPEQNTRSVSVYQSLGFVPSGRSRDALWNASQTVTRI
mgnify:CR=1 FL=1